jgi:hypothetical protein
MHEFGTIVRWTLSDDKRVFAFSRDDGVVVYIVSKAVSVPAMVVNGGFLHSLRVRVAGRRD